MSTAGDPLGPRLGEELAPDLSLVRLLGRSATSVIYLAREPALRRLVAVKVMAPELARDGRARLRFTREAQSAARISHPNVVGVHRVGVLSDGLPYLVMQYVKGRNLAARLEAEGPLPVAETRRLVAEIASALAAAHARGIVHRDVKPANVLYEEETGRALVTDFGLAAVLPTGEEEPNRVTTAGHVIGDTRYMSPERLRGEEPTEAADVYSLGVVAFELLTARLPFDAASGAQLVSAHLSAEPRRVSMLRPDADLRLDDLLHRCLAKVPEHRPGAADIVRALASGAAPEGAPGLVTEESSPYGDLRTAAGATEAARESPLRAERLTTGSMPAGAAASRGAPRARAAGTGRGLRLEVLGALELRAADGHRIISVLAQPKRLALLTYLSLEAGERLQRRDTILGVFWPELDEERARHALRQGLYVLRRSLGSEVFATRGDEEVGLQSGTLSCDALEFVRAVREDRPEEAMELYRGPLLPGFLLPGSTGFERWLEDERERLARLAAAAAWRLAESSERAGDGVAAAHWARRAAELAPFDEGSLRRLIELLDRQGDRAGALSAYDGFARRLAEDLGAEPAPETRQMISRLRGG